MPKLTKPGISDLHWQVTVMEPEDIRVSFWETELDAVEHAGIALAIPRTSVYVSQVMHQGEHLRARRAEPTSGPARRGGGGRSESVTAESLTDEQIHELRDRVMGGSPLSEDTLVATGDLILDDDDPDVNIAVARERIAAAINARRGGVSVRPAYAVMPSKSMATMTRIPDRQRALSAWMVTASPTRATRTAVSSAPAVSGERSRRMANRGRSTTGGPAVPYYVESDAREAAKHLRLTAARFLAERATPDELDEACDLWRRPRQESPLMKYLLTLFLEGPLQALTYASLWIANLIRMLRGE